MPCYLQWGSPCRCEGALGPGFAGKNLSFSNVVLKKVNVATSTNQKILGSKFLSEGYFNYCTLLFIFCDVFVPPFFFVPFFRMLDSWFFVWGTHIRWVCPRAKSMALSQWATPIPTRRWGWSDSMEWLWVPIVFRLIQVETCFSLKGSKPMFLKESRKKWNNHWNDCHFQWKW